MSYLVVLVHSPLVGPRSWTPVAACLARMGVATAVPVLRDSAASDEPYWQQEADSVARELEAVPVEQPLALVGHSGAGPLLPAIARAVRQPVLTRLYVDAGLPHGGRSRLDEMAANNPEFAAQLRAHLAAGGRFPEWREDDLRDLVPDAALRRGLVAELRPRPLAFFTEPLPDYPEQPEPPSGYVLFSAPYASQAAAARQRGWPCREFAAGHFHLLADPEAVAATLRELLNALVPAGD